MSDSKVDGSMTVVSLTVDSFKRIKAAHVIPSKTGIVLVRGLNEEGKSSLIGSMEAALKGRAGKVEKPITEGAHGAEVVVDLGALLVTRTWQRDSGGEAVSKLAVVNAEGVPQKAPQALLDDFVSNLADPVALLNADAKDQVAMILEALGLTEELSQLEAEVTAHYEERRFVGRDVTRTKKALEAMAVEVGTKPIIVAAASVDDLTAELMTANARNARIDKVENARVHAERRGADLTKRRNMLQASLEELNAEIDHERKRWESCTNALGDLGKKLDTAPMIAAIAAHEEGSKLAGKRDLFEKMKDEHEAAVAKQLEAATKLAYAQEKIRELLAGADFPVDGMAYDADTKSITIDGLPFSQASDAQRLTAAATIAMAGDPKIKVMFAKQGSLMDAKHRQLLAEICEREGFQLWLEVVDDNPEGAGVWIEDGEAFQNDERISDD